MRKRSVLVIAALLLAAGCSKTPPEPLPSTEGTLSVGDVQPWPFKVKSITYQCNDMDGGATTVINGVTYGLTGRDALHQRIRGYGEIEDVLIQPYSEYLLKDLKSNVTVNCIFLMHRYDEAWKKQNS